MRYDESTTKELAQIIQELEQENARLRRVIGNILGGLANIQNTAESLKRISSMDTIQRNQ